MPEGDLPPSTLKSLVPRIHGAVLFVYGEHGQPGEQRECERRVIAFFDRALAERTVDRDANGPTVRAAALAFSLSP